MASARPSGKPLRDLTRPATAADIEQLRLALETKIGRSIADATVVIYETQKHIAEMEKRLTIWTAGIAAAAGVAVIGLLVGILLAVD